MRRRRKRQTSLCRRKELHSDLRAAGKLSRDTPILTTVHPVQLIDEAIPREVHDIPADYIVTATGGYRGPHVAAAPGGHLLEAPASSTLRRG